MSLPKPRTKAEIKLIHVAADAVDAALIALEAAAHLGLSNPPSAEAAKRLVRGAQAHTSQWRGIGDEGKPT